MEVKRTVDIATKNIRANCRNGLKERFGCLAVRSWECEHYQDFRVSGRIKLLAASSLTPLFGGLKISLHSFSSEW